MRVIAGSAGGRRLSAPKGNRVRPTADRVKEALFSMLLSRFGSFDGIDVLDLFAGTGNLGIEALSRGAGTAVFVDSHRQSQDIIRANLALTGLSARSSLLPLDALTALKRLSREQRLFDIIFMDPPYHELDLIQEVLGELSRSPLISEQGIVILESNGKMVPALPDNLTLLETRLYGDTAIHILEQTQKSSPQT